MKTTMNAKHQAAIDAARDEFVTVAVRQLYTMLRGESTTADLFAAMNATVDRLAVAENALPRFVLNGLARCAMAAFLEAGWGKDAADKWMAAH